ncbi:uncharacterized protein LOC134220105 [Armigeres subalbatus]|uniref:uncharacterized protein LOC134220105 n=1 Tax=Armigeres subalbatus TaxID=124917 RepID=UPI002ED3E564
MNGKRITTLIKMETPALADCSTGLRLINPIVRTTTWMQVEIGSVRTTAHRTQIRPFIEPTVPDRPNLMLPMTNTRSMTRAIGESAEMPTPDISCEDPGADAGKPTRSRRKRRMESTTPIELRRSKRSRMSKTDPDFVYFN